MHGLMQYHPLLISGLVEHAAREHGDIEIVSRTVEGPVHRTTWSGIASRAARVANLLARLGVGPGERVATLAWNGYRHLELLFGVSGAGVVLHTVNPRLFPEQIQYIIDHAANRYVFFDLTFAGLIAELAPKLPTVRGYVALCRREDLPAAAIPNLMCYEDLLAAEEPDCPWPELDERTASSLCYTSGTTGNPKGVLYTHRSTLLHAMAACSIDGMGLSSQHSLLLATPMFHVNGWGAPYAAAMCGAKLVLPGPHLDGASSYRLMKDEAVTMTLGVPTIWLALTSYVAAEGLEPKKDLKLNRVLIGGSAAPAAQVEEFERTFGARVIHAWGMTETSPLGTTCTPKARHRDDTLEERVALQSKQGRPPYGVELKIAGPDGQSLPRDGRSAGHLLIRGHWVTSGYFGGDGTPLLDAEDYFDTGDIGTLDGEGYLQITDRSKDVIKSGGEWISSIDLENAALGHPGVAEAAAIGVAHPKWLERPLLVVVRRPGGSVSAAELGEFLAGRVAKWWLPDAIEFVAELPHTATGKLQKLKLREIYRDYRLPGT
jgi:acyl-CoA synthetase (AMP-forming)/AMP-acid ligase II